MAPMRAISSRISAKSPADNIAQDKQAVSAYILAAPKDAREKLAQLRKLIRAAAPKAQERMSYGMPYYSYRGRLAYFAHAKEHIGLYVMPPVIVDHARELNNYSTSKATVRFPLSKPLPVALIKKLIKAGMRNNELRATLRK